MRLWVDRRTSHCGDARILNDKFAASAEGADAPRGYAAEVHLITPCSSSLLTWLAVPPPQGPGDQAVEEVHAILRQIVGMVLNSADCVALQRFTMLKREIAAVAGASLEKMKVPRFAPAPRLVEAPC